MIRIQCFPGKLQKNTCLCYTIVEVFMKRMLLIVLLALVVSFFCACDETEDDDYYRFKITSTGNKFFGIYTIDADKDVYISDTKDVEQKGNYYFFDTVLDSPSTISIKVDGFDYNEAAGTAQTTRITIEVFEGKELVKESYITASSYDQHLYLTLYYKFKGNDDNDDDDSDDDDDDSEE